MEPYVKLINYSFIFFSMLGIAFKISRQDISSNLKDKGLMARSLLANFIVVPLIGFILLKIFPLEQMDSIALMLLAVSPGGLSSLQFTTKSKNNDSLGYAAVLSGILSILSLILTPILILIFRDKEFDLNVPYGEFAFVALFLIILPLAIGIFTGERKPELAAKLAKISAILGTLLFFTLIIYTLSDAKAAKSSTDSQTIIAILIFIGLSIITGWALGGPGSEKRRILAAITSMRNFSLIILLIIHTAPGIGLEYPVMAFASLMVPPNMLILFSYTLYMKRKLKKENQKSNNN